MSLTYALIFTIGICILAAGFEGASAGKGVKDHFATLRFPKYSAPLPVWYAIGGIYYLVFGFLLYRMFRIDGGSILPLFTIGYMVFLMLANGSWNYIFFRRQDLFTAFILGAIAPVFDIALL